MKRRDFVKKISVVGTIPFLLDGIAFNSMSYAAPLQRMASLCPNDNVLIILQMHGGNDGINMLIPHSNYDQYYNARPNIAIPENGNRKLIGLDSTLSQEQQIGLHPSMTGIKRLYDQGNVNFVQGVSYENHNGSHFRSRDIMFMGCGANDYTGSGWVGRALKEKFAPLQYPNDFPNQDMLDPLALEFGNEVSLVFHQGDNIPTSISINNPEDFFELVNTLPGFEDKDGVDPRGIPPVGLDGSPYSKELNWILNLEQKTDQYGERMLETYKAGKKYDQGVVYPTTYPFKAPKERLKNPLAGPLKVIANLLSGGSKTKVFLVKIGGFDTHAEQVDSGDRTMGNHAALLYHISEAMKSFQEDLKTRSLDERVLTVTTSEFGRRIYSNGSYGTDHGVGAPVMIFGNKVQPGIIGKNPDLSKDNVEMQYDYRQIYASILKDWMCVDPALVDNEFGMFFGDYQGRGQTMPIIRQDALGVKDFILKRFRLNSCYPNPASVATTISFFINNPSMVEINLLNTDGRKLKTLLNEPRGMGENQILVDLKEIPSGLYYYEIKAGLLNDTKKLLIAK
jgi:uncharacterized protein (DUF1501 family)